MLSDAVWHDRPVGARDGRPIAVGLYRPSEGRHAGGGLRWDDTGELCETSPTLSYRHRKVVDAFPAVGTT